MNDLSFENVLSLKLGEFRMNPSSSANCYLVEFHCALILAVLKEMHYPFRIIDIANNFHSLCVGLDVSPYVKNLSIGL